MKRFDPGDQAELVEAAPNGLEGYRRPFIRHRGWIQGYQGSRCSHILFHGVAPLRGFDTPSLSAQGEQRSSLICNIDRDILSDAYRFGGQRVCSNPQVRTDRLDAAVWREVENLIRDPGRLALEYRRRLDQAHNSDGARADIAALETQIAKLRRGIGRLIDSYAEGVIDKPDFEPRIAGFRQRLAALEQHRTEMQNEEALQITLSLIIGRLEDFAGRVRDTLSTTDWHQRRELIRLLVKRVEVDMDDINIVFRVSPVPSAPAPADPSRPILQDCGRRAFAPLKQSRARRPRQGAGPTGSPVLPVRG